MTEKEIELAMEGLFRGASRARAYKQTRNLSKNVHRRFSSRIALQMWNKKKKDLRAA